MGFWLKRGENLSWETLTEAVVDMGHLDIATQIQEKYLQVRNVLCMHLCTIHFLTALFSPLEASYWQQ